MKRSIIIAAAVIIVGVLVWAHGPGMGTRGVAGAGRDFGGMRGWDKVDKLADEIGLSEEQVEQIEEIRTTGAKKVADLKADEEKAEIDLTALIGDPEVKSSEIEKAIQTVLEKEQTLKMLRVKILLDIRDVLTVEQREKVQDVIKEKRKEMQKNRENMQKDFHGGSGSGKAKFGR